MTIEGILLQSHHIKGRFITNNQFTLLWKTKNVLYAHAAARVQVADTAVII